MGSDGILLRRRPRTCLEERILTVGCFPECPLCSVCVMCLVALVFIAHVRELVARVRCGANVRKSGKLLTLESID